MSMSISMSPYGIIIPNFRYFIIVNAQPDDQLDILVMMDSPCQVNYEDIVSVFHHECAAYTVCWIELKTHESGPVARFMDGSLVLDQHSVNIIADFITSYESYYGNTYLENDKEICVICQEEFEAGQLCMALKCTHWWCNVTQRQVATEGVSGGVCGSSAVFMGDRQRYVATSATTAAANSLQSKIDQTSKISKSVFISNFPDDCSSRDLWKVCNGYGTVVDVFIPNKRSKAGKRFAFVRFINVLNLDRLIENLKTIWIGRFHLSANPARFERPKASTFQKEKPVPSGNVTGFKQSIVQNQGGPKESYSSILKPSLVLDDSCLVNRDLTNCVMGEVLQFSSINNLQVLLSNEGFHNTRVVYLGGLWVMIELKSSKSKSKFMEHVGVASWFRRLCNAQSDFAAKERIVWVDIEGVPLNAWTRSTFQKISSKWGELVELEDGYDDLFARKRICIKTNQTENILESFKLIVKGKVFWARAKELFVWSPSFKDVPEKELFSDDESTKINEQANNLNNDEVENASEVVSDTYFGDNGEVQGFEHQHGESNDKEVSSDPFNIYDLLNKRTTEVRTTDMSIPYPSGFTPANDIPACNNQDIPEAES
ncbi:RNA-directed DNA polymerase, eukaryota, partial [Tanacetum coccineum]